MLSRHMEMAGGVVWVVLVDGALWCGQPPLEGVRVVPVWAVLVGHFVSSAGCGPVQLAHLLGRWLQVLRLSSDEGHSRQVWSSSA